MSSGKTGVRSTSILLATQIFLTAARAEWIDRLPPEARASILWSADHEEGTLSDWTYPQFEYPGGGVLNTGGEDAEAAAVATRAHSGRFSAAATIRNAIRAENGNRAVRLMRWTDRPWDDHGGFLPRAAYYSTWMFFPQTMNPNKYEPWDPGDGGWWNVFQFKANDSNDQSQPMWTLNVDHDDRSGRMSFYLYSKYNSPASHAAETALPIPVGEWVHVEAYYLASHVNEGRITIWQNGQRIIDVADVRTVLTDEASRPIWGIGSYTDHIAGGPEAGSATIFFDDCIISTRRISQYVRHGLQPQERRERDAPPGGRKSVR